MRPCGVATSRRVPAGLHHSDDSRPGIRRIRAGSGFRYAGPRGPVRDAATLERIRAIVIPPAWESVWICPDPRGHVQATGRDARGRKQYRYHAEWNRVRSQGKYDRLAAFAKVLPRIRRRVRKDLARRGLPREKVLALVVRLLETTHARIGNDEYSRLNRSYGLTTLHDAHARDAGRGVRLRFRGKSGVAHDIAVTDPRLARLVRSCRELPGQQLFQYVDERGRVRDVGSGDVNAYLREIAGADFTAKDFRTWSGTCLAAAALCERPARGSARRLVAVVKEVAAILGNRPATCRKHYIHPAVFVADAEGALERLAAGEARAPAGLRHVEALVLGLLAPKRSRRG
jgi:DNA topoisomerase-1